MTTKYKRTQNSTRNIAFGMILKCINIVGAFLARTMLIYVLGVEFAGIDGLFSSILNILSLAELGFSSAVVYKLYKPIADGDETAVCALLRYYQKIYRVIGAVILIAGIAVTPFLPRIIKGDVPNAVNIYILYFIYLFDTCIGYWLFAYKNALINAHQRTDLVSRVTSAMFIGKYFLQFMLLLLFRNYYVYAIVIPMTTLGVNIGTALIARRHYPQYVPKGEIAEDNKKEIKKKVSALVYNKVGVALISGSDNIVISAFLGLTTLGIYSSYYYVFKMLHSIFNVFFSAITGGVGNSIVTESVEHNHSVFGKLCFINAWITGWSSICMCCIFEPFIKLWIKDSFSWTYSILMAVYFYCYMIRFIIIVYKNAQGLWWEDRYRAFIEAAVNLTLNIIMVRYIGIFGVTLSTVIAMLAISLPWETKVLFDKYFKKSPRSYYLKLFGYTIITVIIGTLTYLLCLLVKGNLWWQLFYRSVICIVVPNGIYYLTYGRTNNFRYAIGLIKRFIKRSSENAE